MTTTSGATATTDEVLAGQDLSGCFVVVTGASSGLGLETARALAAHGATVAMTVRDVTRGAALLDIVGGRNRLVALDLTSLASIRQAAADIRAESPHVDVLVNNAGVMATPEGRTAEGFELQLGVNHIGHFLLTALLAPVMPPTARVVNVSSLGHLVSGMLWDDPHYRTRPYNKWEAYGQSKTANILFTVGLATRGRTAYAVHPGRIATELARYLPEDERAAIEGPANDVDGGAKTVAQGAATSVWAATAQGIPTGSYLADCAVAEALPHATDAAAAERLWTWSEDQVGQTFAP
jgi:NAD(P)-dependent dehydrogenase (short-subunit alcohol dehydrogenase family)